MAVSPPQSSTATPRSKGVHGSISKDVRQDYTCYYIYSQDNRSVAVVIEAKLQKNSTYKNVIPQVSLFVGLFLVLSLVTCNRVHALTYLLTLIPSRLLDTTLH